MYGKITIDRYFGMCKAITECSISGNSYVHISLNPQFQHGMLRSWEALRLGGGGGGMWLGGYDLEGLEIGGMWLGGLEVWGGGGMWLGGLEAGGGGYVVGKP